MKLIKIKTFHTNICRIKAGLLLISSSKPNNSNTFSVKRVCDRAGNKIVFRP